MIGISIVLYRSRLPLVAVAFQHLAAQMTPPGRVAVHVNAATPGEQDRVRDAVTEAAPGLRSDVTASVANTGFAGGHNLLLSALFRAGCEAVVVHNPDLGLAPDALRALRAADQQVPTPCLLGPVLELADTDRLDPTGLADTLGIRWTRSGRHLDVGQGDPLPHFPATPRPVAGISGACLYVPKATWQLVVDACGEFFDETFLAYREDAELAYRASLLGVRSWLVPAARGRHLRGLRGTTRETDPAINRLGVQNRFLIAFKYGRRRPGGAVTPLFRDLVVIAGVLTRERSSLPGLRRAWHLRRLMREKGRRLNAEMCGQPPG